MKLLKILFLFIGIFACAQETPEQVTDEIVVVGQETLDTIQPSDYTKSPVRASLYSAVLPGLGQVYNEKLWKVPIIWTLLGVGAGVIFYYNDEYNRFRDAFIAEINGQEHEFTSLNFSAERLADLQNDRRRVRDYAIVATSLIYILNIVDAAVDAHLFEFDNNPDLSFEPTVIYDNVSFAPHFGVGLKLSL